jgi:stringent starvation protein B
MLPPTAKPYLLRAIYDWCLAEGHTPYVLVAAAQPGVRFPAGYDKDGRLTLNLDPRAVQGLELGPDRIRFMARFGARVAEVEVPLVAVIAVFAAESHEGIIFGEPPAPAAPLEEAETAPHSAEPPAASDGASGNGTGGNGASGPTPEPAPDAESESRTEPESGKGGPRLRLVK